MYLKRKKKEEEGTRMDMKDKDRVVFVVVEMHSTQTAACSRYRLMSDTSFTVVDTESTILPD